MKASEFLTRERWTKGAFGRDEAGVAANPCREEGKPVSFCIHGAMLHIYHHNNLRPELRKWYDGLMFKLKLVLKIKYGWDFDNASIASWNDSPERTYEEVNEVLCLIEKDLPL